jgi:hypothetical protein
MKQITDNSHELCFFPRSLASFGCRISLIQISIVLWDGVPFERDSNLTVDRDLHPKKHRSLRFRREKEIQTDESDEQPRNAYVSFPDTMYAKRSNQIQMSAPRETGMERSRSSRAFDRGGTNLNWLRRLSDRGAVFGVMY